MASEEVRPIIVKRIKSMVGGITVVHGRLRMQTL
jgi:hypothetical protein